MERPQWILPVLVGGLLGAGAVLVIGRPATTHAGPRPARGEDEARGGQLEVLAREVGELKRMIQDRALTAPSPLPREAVVASTPEGEAPAEDLLERLEALEAAVVRSAAASSGMQERLDRFHPVQFDEIQRTAAQMASDYEATQRSLQLMTLTEAIDRFGFPDQVEGAQGSAYDMYWAYKTRTANGELYAPLEFYFVNGRVMHVEARWED